MVALIIIIIIIILVLGKILAPSAFLASAPLSRVAHPSVCLSGKSEDPSEAAIYYVARLRSLERQQIRRRSISRGASIDRLIERASERRHPIAMAIVMVAECSINFHNLRSANEERAARGGIPELSADASGGRVRKKNSWQELSVLTM